ncbi:MAG TPA: thioredoxin-like domain-containing protein [Bacteroidia bacterium]|nr:thioredoxin-like domain-containing protein [Bacteroidia bacterium]
MKQHSLILAPLLCSVLLSAQPVPLVSPGSKAPSFVLNRGENAIQGFTMPYMNKIVLLHFWNSTQASSSKVNHQLRWLHEHYYDADYINADGFEVIAVAVQNNQEHWRDCIQRDSLQMFVNGIAPRGLHEDDACVKFGLNRVPTDILIDENGTVVMLNPKMLDVENFLDSKKNTHALRKDLRGMFAQASSPEDRTRFTRVYLFNRFGDSLAFTRTNEKGVFLFHDVRLRQDLVLRLDNQMDIITSDPIALYSIDGELLASGKTASGGFEFNLQNDLSAKLEVYDSVVQDVTPLEIIITKSLAFKNNGENLSTKDEADISAILTMMQKSKTAVLEVVAHTDTGLDPVPAKQLTDKQCLCLKTYFVKKGIPTSRLRFLSAGNNQPRVNCAPNCSEKDHQQNRRVEFSIFKN